MTEPSSLEPSIALCAYAEPLASNRRVLVFGSALASLPLQLLERGARSVHVSDPNAARVLEASARNRSTQISFSSLADSDLALQDGAFDLALIDNLGAFDALSIVRTAKRAVGARGVAVVACPNPDATFPLLRASHAGATSLDYYALYDAVAAEFEHVRMLGQTPFVGYAIADFSASGEPEPALDTSFVPGGAEEPDSFLALASDHEVRLDEFAVIQLPTQRLLSSLVAPARALPNENLAQNKARDAEIVRLNQWIKELESRASTADERADHSETELEELRPKLLAERQTQASSQAQHDREQSALRAELSALRTQATTLRAESSALRVESNTLRNELSEKSLELARVAAECARLEGELAARDQQLAGRDQLLAARDQQLATQGQKLAAQNQQLAGRDQLLAARDQSLAAQNQQLATQGQKLALQGQELAEQIAKIEQAAAAELADLERQLQERGHELRKLEQDLRTTERTGRELVRELERSRSEASASANSDLERALAEREADLQAAAWTIESLSLRLELAAKAVPMAGAAPESVPLREEAR